MAFKPVDIQQNLVIVSSLESVPAGYVGLGAKADGLYMRMPGGADQKLAAGALVPVSDILFWDGAKYVPYAAKKATDPGYPYFYVTGESPSFTSQLRLDGQFSARSLSASGAISNSPGNDVYISFNGGNIIIQRLRTQNQIITFSDGTSLEAVNNNTAGGYSGAKVYIGDKANKLGNNEWVCVDLVARLLDVKMNAIRIQNGIAGKFMKLNVNKEIEYVDGVAITPDSGILNWANNKYAPYPNKKPTDFGAPYFYVNSGAIVFPTQTHRMCLDGILYTAMHIAGNAQRMSVMQGNVVGLIDIRDSWSNYFQMDTFLGEYLLRSYATNGEASRSNPIKIGDSTTAYGRVNEHIIVDPANRRFEINTQKIKHTQGTAGKWMKLDANKEVEYVDAVENIPIPTLKIKAFNYNGTQGFRVSDYLIARWDSFNTEFLNYNPEIWAFRYNDYARKKTAENTILPVELCMGGNFNTGAEAFWQMDSAACEIARSTLSVHTGTTGVIAAHSVTLQGNATYLVSISCVTRTAGYFKTWIAGGNKKLLSLGLGPVTDVIQTSSQGGVLNVESFGFIGEIDEISIFKIDVNSFKTIKKAWKHESHLNGIKYPGSNFYGGSQTGCPCAEINAVGRKTEFALTSLSGEAMEIPFDAWDYIWGATVGVNGIKLNDNFDFRDITDWQMTRGAKTIPFRFAIVIDNPNPNAANPKVIGELSDVFEMKRHRVQTGAGVTWNWRVIFTHHNFYVRHPV